MNVPLISIIVPVYNVEKYLKRCIDSICAQSYHNIEVILVDDGSTDGSGMLCDEYCNADKRIKVLHKENGGISDARNNGLKYATGDYITFVDSDDCVNIDYIAYLADLAMVYDADIAICGYEYFANEYPTASSFYPKEKINKYTGLEALEMFCYQRIPMEPWAKLYKSEVFEHIFFPTARIYDDYGTIYKLFYKSKIVVYASLPKYYYYQRVDSTTNSNFSEKNFDRAILTEEFMDFISHNVPSLIRASNTRAFISYFMLLRDCPNLGEYADAILKIRKQLKIHARRVMLDSKSVCAIRVLAILSQISLPLALKIGKLQHQRSQKRKYQNSF